MEHFTHLSTTDLMIAGSVALAGISAFLLVRALYPEKILEQARARVAQSGEATRSARRASAESGEAARSARRGSDSRDEVSKPSARRRLATFGGAIVERIGGYNERLVKIEWQGKMRRKFIAMGRPELRPQDFIAHQEIWLVLFGLLGLGLMNLLRLPPWYALSFALFGFVFPYIWLSDQIRKRHRAIARALPYHIDLLTLSVEAGLDFQAALGTVVEKGRPGPLIDELNMLLSEIRLGKTRAEAMRNMADRVQLPDISAFVANLIQADKMGTSLGKVLRIQSTQMRIHRTHRAEKLANEAPVKMLLPLIGCIFPTVFLILFGPIVYRLLHGG